VRDPQTELSGKIVENGDRVGVRAFGHWTWPCA